MILLHIGCGNRRHRGFINSDKDDMDISKAWRYATESVDGIISMQVLQQLQWRDLMIALKEAHRVLKKGGVMRFGTMLVEDNDPNVALGWNNIILFSWDLIKIVLESVGFKEIEKKKYRDSRVSEFIKVDNRPDRGTTFIECIK